MDNVTELAAIDVRDLDDQPVRLGDRLDGRTTVLVFIRHFG